MRPIMTFRAINIINDTTYNMLPPYFSRMLHFSFTILYPKRKKRTIFEKDALGQRKYFVCNNVERKMSLEKRNELSLTFPKSKKVILCI